MIHPSYTELMEVMNQGAEMEDEPLVTSRYSVVLATSKRARQLIAGREALVNAPGNKPLSTAVEEFYKGKVHIMPEEAEEAAEEAEERTGESPVEAEACEETSEENN